MEMKHKKAKVGYTAKIPKAFLLFPWKSHKNISFRGGIFISISILFEDISYVHFVLFRNFYSLSLCLEVCMVVFNEGICNLLEIIVFNYKMPVISPAVLHTRHTWLWQPVVSSFQVCASVKFKFKKHIFINSWSIFSYPCFLGCCPLIFLV